MQLKNSLGMALASTETDGNFYAVVGIYTCMTQ